MHLLDTVEDALYTAEAGNQLSIFNLNDGQLTETEQGIQELKETGRYNSEAARQRAENIRQLDEAYQKTRNQGPERLIKEDTSFQRGKRYATNNNSSKNKKLIEATEKAEELTKAAPNGFIPDYNVNASDVALEAAVSYRDDPTAKEPPKDIPFEEGSIPEEIADLSQQAGYVGSSKSWGRRLLDDMQGGSRNETIGNIWSIV